MKGGLGQGGLEVMFPHEHETDTIGANGTFCNRKSISINADLDPAAGGFL